MKLYAVAVQAHMIVSNSIKVEVNAGALVACDKDEALGKAIGSAEREWPVRQGWFGHSAAVVEVPQRMIDDVTAGSCLCAACLRRVAEGDER